jgi:hypothetical protein
MKAVLSVVLAVTCVAAARADWKDVKRGMDAPAVMRAIGAPLLQNKARAIAQTWTYDAGGFVLFEGGRAVYWEPSKPAKPTPSKPTLEAKTGRPLPAANLIAKS